MYHPNGFARVATMLAANAAKSGRAPRRVLSPMPKPVTTASPSAEAKHQQAVDELDVDVAPREQGSR